MEGIWKGTYCIFVNYDWRECSNEKGLGVEIV